MLAGQLETCYVFRGCSRLLEDRLELGAVVHGCNPSYSRVEIATIAIQGQPGKIVQETLSQKNPSQKRLVEWLKP
jgi:hypothetical protein